ncbi:MAG: (d)CMP kinase [Pseudonocardiaceae bacterium]|nr:(d)CMP kinase [Pseudonocardiaceae bacterium]
MVRWTWAAASEQRGDRVARGRLDGVIALDGPSGTGKSTVARALARRLDAGYLDTGAMYRAVTLAVLRAGVDPADDGPVFEIAERVTLELGNDPDGPTVTLDGADVAAEIRGAAVTAAVSAVSAVGAVRELLVGEQRRIIARVLEERGGIVVEGRDIGTTVAPAAGLKVFLTASADARAQRRSTQDVAEGRASTVDGARVDVDRRDRLDSTRASSPLRAAPDAVELDTTEIDQDDVLTRLLELVAQRGMLDNAEAGSR